MGISDPIADMFTVIRNAVRAKQEKTEFPSSRIKLEILDVLKKEGYIKNFKHISDNRQGRVRVYLKFKDAKQPAITHIKRVSKSSLRVYVNKDEVPKVLRGMGIAILSTSKGIITDGQARKQGIGGEIICYVW